MVVSPNYNLNDGPFLLQTTLHSVLLQVALRPFFSLSFITFCISCTYFSVSAINTVTSVYIMAVGFWAPIMNPCRTNFLRKTLFYIYTSSEPCLTLLFSDFFHYLFLCFCCQYRLFQWHSHICQVYITVPTFFVTCIIKNICIYRNTSFCICVAWHKLAYMNDLIGYAI